MEQKKFSRLDLLTMAPANMKEVRLDLGCGLRKKEGYIGIDITQLPGVDIVYNIENGLPFEDNSVDGIYSNFLFEHLPNTIFLFKELYRVCKNGSIIEFLVPYYQSNTQYKDPTHKSIILPETLRYFSDDKWYGSDYNIDVNFKVIELIYNYLPPFDKWSRRRFFFLRPILYPLRSFAKRYLWNVVHSIKFSIEVIK